MRVVSATLVVTVLGLAVSGVGWAQKPADEHVPGRLLAQRAAAASDTEVGQLVTLFGAKVHHKIDAIGVLVLDVPEPALDAVTQALMRSGRFTFVERDFLAHTETITPNDPEFPSQWHLTTIQAPNAWTINKGSASMPIAIIDSGADPTQPDLAPKLIAGWNFLTGTANTADTGCNTGHGTAVAGAAAAATNNLIGVAGVAWANTIMPLVVTSSGCVAMYSDIASAINYAADHGARIINISVAGSTASSTLQNAVNYAWNKGAVVFAAAGNSSSSSPVYPAACTNAVAVSATVSGDTLASFSNYGSWITLSAPGNMILTTQVGGSYGYWWGTSLASPIAAGVGALALAANPSLTASQLVTLLKQHSDDLGAAGFDQYFGWGRVNAYKAVAAAAGVTADSTPPKVSISSPLSGATVAGTVAVTGTSTDNVGVTKVEFYVDGVLSASGTAASFSFSWNSTAVVNGSHSLTAKAYDAAGNTASASVSVTVNNIDTTPPKVTIASPLTGATVAGTVAVIGTATDNVGVTKVEFYIDGVLSTSGTVAAFSFSWNSTSKANGSHTITLKAYDAAKNIGSASLSVTVNNSGDTTPPKVTIASPLTGATVAGTASVTGTATDNVGVTKVEFYVDGVLSASGTAASFSFSWNSTSVANGSHTLMAKAYDAAGNTSSASVSVTVSNAATSQSTQQPVLQIHADATELSGLTNGSIVKPGIAPTGFTGKLVLNGTGSVNFTPAAAGNGVYFLKCCTNTNNAYYKFTGATIGNIFNTNQGQVTFYLKSRYSFAQRLAGASAPRYAFDVRDGNNNHLFFFYTKTTSTQLMFTYATGGTAQYYFAPQGTEDHLFGLGVLLKVTLTWNGSSMNLYLNGTLVKTTAYVRTTPNWSAASNFDLGAYEYLTAGGYNGSDDVIR